MIGALTLSQWLHRLMFVHQLDSRDLLLVAASNGGWQYVACYDAGQPAANVVKHVLFCTCTHVRNMHIRSGLLAQLDLHKVFIHAVVSVKL